mgnify:CR=1 FL=1
MNEAIQHWQPACHEDLVNWALVKQQVKMPA